MRFASAWRAWLPALLLLAGCSTPTMPSLSNLWPFGETEIPERSRKPTNATEYNCEGGRTFYVRMLDASAVWLIAPDREIRLDKKADGRWGVGRVELEMDSARVELTDPPARFTNCKRAG